MKRTKERVDLALAVALADIEDTTYVIEDDQPLLPLQRDLREPAAVQERPQHSRSVLVDIADVIRLVPRAGLLRDLLEPVDVERPVPAFGTAHQRRCFQAGQCLECSALRDARRRNNLIRRTSTEDQRTDDTDPFVVSESGKSVVVGQFAAPTAMASSTSVARAARSRFSRSMLSA